MKIVNKKCLDCGKDFEYDEKPGYPRKYCFSCSAERKKSFATKQEDKPVESVVKSSKLQQNTTMYVSYAKDIFCELRKRTDFTDQMQNSELMKYAIDLVKQARGEFE